MDDTNKEFTAEEAEQDFKNKMASIFMRKVPGAHVDEDGFICIPMKCRKKSDGDTDIP